MSFLDLARRAHGIAGSSGRASVNKESPPAKPDRLAAVLVASPSFGDMWIALDANSARKLNAEAAGLENPLPVLQAEDLARLLGKSNAAIGAALEVLRQIPGTRVLR